MNHYNGSGKKKKRSKIMQVFMQPLENLKEFEEITQKLPKTKVFCSSQAVWKLRKPILCMGFLKR